MRRSSELRLTADALLHPYTYVVTTPDPEKRKNRQTLGKMAAEIISVLADEYASAALLELERSKTL